MGRGKFINSKKDQMPEPTATQAVAMVTGTPGGNLLQVVDASGKSFLCKVPSVFRGKVWAIKGGYLLVDMVQGDEDGDALGKVQATLSQHLYRDQIRHLQSRGQWPAGFEAGEAATGAGASATTSAAASVAPDESSSANEYLEEDEYGGLPANKNRRGLSDSEDEDEDEDGDEDEGDEDEEVVPAVAALDAPEPPVAATWTMGLQDDDR